MRGASLALAAVLVLGGCASLSIEPNQQATQDFARDRLGAELRLLSTDESRAEARADVERMLDRPLASDDAVRIALAFSPALQAMLFEAAAESAAATQMARLPNPILSLERMVRREAGEREVEIGRALGFSLLDLLLLPARREQAADRQARLRTGMAADVLQAATAARQAWVRAVADRQSLEYFEQVMRTAEASAELARRMEAVGNFSRLQRAREQAFYAEATAQLARAEQAARSSREALVRALGLDVTLAARLRLPDRLPDLPATPIAESAAAAALADRLDVRMAQAGLEEAARKVGITGVTSIVDEIHVAALRSAETGEPAWRGWELELPVPVFDLGDAYRAGARASYLAASNRLAQVLAEASSQLREAYGLYRTTHGLARHYRDEVVPLRRLIAEEMLLKYNGMLIGVFELLADARERIGSVVQAIEAQRDFWLADAALAAARLGRPVEGMALAASVPAAGAAPGH